MLVPGIQAGTQRGQQVSFARIWNYGIFRCAGCHRLPGGRRSSAAAPCSREAVPVPAAGTLARELMPSTFV